MTSDKDFSSRDSSGTDVFSRFDAYAASLEDSSISGDVVVSSLTSRLDAEGQVGRPRQGYGRCVELVQGQRHLGFVAWGGRQDRVHVSVQGEASVGVSDLLRHRWPHRVSRADVCIDSDQDGAFERLVPELRSIAACSGLVKRQQGDWMDPHSRPGEGRTLYLGGERSAVRLRAYEKGRQLPEAGRPNWVRTELQVRPPSRRKEVFSRLTPEQMWGASAWSSQVWGLFSSHLVESVRCLVWSAPDGARAREHLLKQYGAVLRTWLGEYGDDGSAFGEMLKLELLQQV